MSERLSDEAIKQAAREAIAGLKPSGPARGIMEQLRYEAEQHAGEVARLREALDRIARESDQFALERSRDNFPWVRLRFIHRTARAALGASEAEEKP